MISKETLRYVIGTILWSVFLFLLGIIGIIAMLIGQYMIGIGILLLAVCIYRHIKKRVHKHNLKLLEEYNNKSDYERMMDAFDMEEKAIFLETWINIMFGR